MAYEYAPSYSAGSTSPESAQKTGLGTAQNVLKNTLNRQQQYPDDLSGSLQGPATGEMSENIGYGSMEKIGGLMGGDYDRLEQNLQQPILNQGQQAQNQIQDVYSGRGLYGSVGGGLMSGAQAQSQQATQDALANTVAQRYALELQDKGQRMSEAEALFKSGALTADQQNQYNRDKMLWDVNQQQQGIDFQNAMAQMQQQYGLDKQNWQTQVDELNFQRALQLAGQGNSGAQAQAMLNQADAAERAALYQGLGSVAGGLMGSYGDGGWTFGGVAEGIGDAWDAIF